MFKFKKETIIIKFKRKIGLAKQNYVKALSKRYYYNM